MNCHFQKRQIFFGDRHVPELGWLGPVGGSSGSLNDGVLSFLGAHIANRGCLDGFFHCLCQSKGILSHLLDLYDHGLRSVSHALLVHGLVLVLGLLCLLTVDDFPHSLHHGALPLDMLHHPLHVGFQLGELLGYPLLEGLVKLLLGHRRPS